jgi:dTDP-4-dehydrorhamnose 3,5-epimerase
MRVDQGALPGVFLFTPTPVRDSRGFFTRTFDVAVATEGGLTPRSFIQDSQSRTARGVIRGLHLRSGQGESKLVRCSWGEIFDVVLDLRQQSPSYGRWMSVFLDDVSHRSVIVPAGCAHGFQALTDPADVCYRIDREHDPSEDVTIAWDDPDLGIEWPLPVTGMSDRDRVAPRLAAVLQELFERHHRDK